MVTCDTSRMLTLFWNENANEMQSVQRLHSYEQWPAAWQPGWMARGSHSFTRHPHVYPRMEWAILHSLRKHSPNGAAGARQHISGSAYYSSIDLERMKGGVGLVGWPCSGWYPHKWSSISCRSSVRQGKFADQRPAFYRCATQPTIWFG